MSTTVITDSPSPSDEDGHRRVPQSSQLFRLLKPVIIGLAAGIAALVLAAIALGVFFVAGSGEEDASEEVLAAPAAESGSDEAAGGSDTVTGEATPADDPLGDTSNLVGVLAGFGRAWEDADWGAMEAVATSEVVETAHEWHSDGGKVSQDIAQVIDGCSFGSTCELGYFPADGRGLLFRLTFGADAEGALIVTDLEFAGDMG